MSESTNKKHNYQQKYQLTPELTNKYCESVYNPTVQPDGKTEMGVPIPTTENVEYSKEYEEDNQK
ncbi:MAG: hypothetical protein ACI4IG_05075 [Eubacterium sp.]